MKLRNHITPYLIILALIIPLMGLTACGSGGGGGGDTGGGAEPVSIGPDGGTVISEDGMVSVIVPKEALTGEVVITIDPVSGPPAGNIGTAYEFGPAGMVFGEPVAIVIKYDEAALPSDIKVKEADLRLGKLVSNQWQLVSDSMVDTDADTVAGATTGFSIYGIIAIEESINSLPLADAGADRTVMTGSTVSLDGSGSSDADDDPLTYIWTMTSRPEGSVAALSGDATKTPSFVADKDGSYVITLVVNDGIADSAPDQVTITASTTAPPNTAPVAVDDDYSVDEDNTLNVDNVGAAGVLTNDTDAENDPLTATLVNGPLNGALTLHTDGSFTYTPNENFNGMDGFTYQASDGGLDSNTATVTITVNPVNDAPVSMDDEYSVDEDDSLIIIDASSGVLVNDTDMEGDTLTVLDLVATVDYGVLMLNEDGSFTYTPDANFNGTDIFAYRASDGALDSNTATVTITVNPVNDAPVSMDDEYSVDEDGSLIIGVSSGVLVNDTDMEGDTLTVLDLVATVDYGVLMLNEDGSFTYEPDGDFHGTDGFTYQAYDGALYSNEAKVTIMVNPEVGAFYPSNGRDWNDYVKNDGIDRDRFKATDTAACVGTETGGYSACIHGGEMRSVEVPDYTGDNSCDGLTATDALGAFDWTCVVINSQATMVSTGLKDLTPVTGTTYGHANQVTDGASFITDGVEVGDTVINTTQYTTTTVASIDSETQLTLADHIFSVGDSYSINRDKNLSDLIDFSAPGWKSNSVTVKDGAATLFTTPSTTWWVNPVATANSGGSLSTEGTVYLVTADPISYYTLEANKIALVIKPGVTLTGSGGYGTLIYARLVDFLWLEGRLDADGEDYGLDLDEVRFSVLRGVQADNGDYNIVLEEHANNNMLKNVIANNINAGMSTGISLWLADYNTLENVVAAGNPDGVNLQNSSNNTLTNIAAVNNSRHGIWFYSSSNNSLSNVTANNNGDTTNEVGVGVLFDSSSNNSLSNITVADNIEAGVLLIGSSNNSLLNVTASGNNGPEGGGVYLKNASDNNSLSNVTAAYNDYHGVYLEGSSNNDLTNITANNNGAEGISLYGSSNNALSNVTANNNNFCGVGTLVASDNSLSDITTTNNLDCGVALNNSSNNSLSNVTAAHNKRYGVYLISYASNNSLSNITASNNGEMGVGITSDSNSNILTNITASNNGESGGVYIDNSSHNSLLNVTATNNAENGVSIFRSLPFKSSSNNILSDITAANNANIGFHLNTSSNNILSNITTANNHVGIYVSASSDNNSLSNVTAANNGGIGVWLWGSSNNYFTGLLKVGNPSVFDCSDNRAETFSDTNCTAVSPSDFSLTQSVTLASSFVAKVGTGGSGVDTTEDSANQEDNEIPGTATYPADPSAFDWTSFDNRYRSWGIDGSAFPNADHRGQWTAGTGRIWDWSLANGDTGDAGDPVVQSVLTKPLTGNAVDTIEHSWTGTAVDQVDCDDIAPGSVWIGADNCRSTFLRNAVEIMGDSIGNDNGLCESGETCLYTPNIGSYQGHGALQSAGTFTTNGGGTITGVTLLEYDTNGY